ncbi:MAG: hypothetical protein LUF29_05110 [Oscillospiraceae bacterium]|nr:hypothetical protein [Oscillospiraceae bacterium]
MKKSIVIPTVRLDSDYFRCPKCGWVYPVPLLIKGDYAESTRCEKCGHVGLVRVK